MGTSRVVNDALRLLRRYNAPADYPSSSEFSNGAAGRSVPARSPSHDLAMDQSWKDPGLWALPMLSGQPAGTS